MEVPDGDLHNGFPAELIKLRRSPVWIVFFAIPLISALIGTFNFVENQGALSFSWGSLWTQQSLFLGMFFLSPLIGIVCSLLWRMEHNGTVWNLVLTVESPAKIVRDKLLTVSGLSALCMLWVGVLFVLSGKSGWSGVPDSGLELCSALRAAAIRSRKHRFAAGYESAHVHRGLCRFHNRVFPDECTVFTEE